MEIKLPDNKLVKEMAEEVATTGSVYYNFLTGKWKGVLYDEMFYGGEIDCDQWSDTTGETEDECQKQQEQFEKDFPSENTIYISKMPGYEAYNRLLKKFIDEYIENPQFAGKLYDAIHGRGAFSRFRRIIDNSDYYETWLEHRDRENILYFIDNFKDQLGQLLYKLIDNEEADKIIKQFEEQTKEFYTKSKWDIYEEFDDKTKLEFLDWLIVKDDTILTMIKRFAKEKKL